MKQDEEPEFHEPSDEAYACLRLELRRPVLVDDDSNTVTRAWREIRECHRAIGRGVQLGFGNVVVHIRKLRDDGKARFATPAEKLSAKMGAPLPVECYTDDDLKPIAGMLGEALKRSGTSEYVWSSVARRLSQSELAGEKLKGLLRGDQAYPTCRNVGVMMRARNWKIYFEAVERNGKDYLDVVVEVAALRPGIGRLRLHCASMHGKQLQRSRQLINTLAMLEESTSGGGWSKGALTLMPVRRPGQPEKWFLLLPYSAPRAAVASGMTLAIHRGVVNMLTAATSTGDVYQFPGRDVVALKAQMYARRAAVARDLAANPHRGRGVKHHYAALARFADAEKRATQTHLWRAARWAQATAERVGASLVLLDDFGSFDPDLPGPPVQPYVRRFPLADLKLKIIDALTRRAGIPVQEISSRYISQRCPKCGHTEAANVARMPKANGVNVEKGWFKCLVCEFATDVDAVAGANLHGQEEKSPPAAEKRMG